MWYTDNEKLDIGRRVYTHEISKEQACKEYDISITTVLLSASNTSYNGTY